MKGLRTYLFLAFGLILGSCLNAQDIHLSQHFFAPHAINPAYTGHFFGQHRFTGNYKNQWPGVKVPYNTIALAWDGKVIKTSKQRNDWISLGAQLYRDVAGDSKFQTLNAKLSIAYQMSLVKGHSVSIGLEGGLVNRGFKVAGLSFDNQWNGDVFDPTLPINETFDRTRFSFFDLGAGFSYGYQLSRWKMVRVGFAMLHLNQPNQSFFTDRNTTLNRNYIIEAQADWALGSTWSILPSVLYQRQDTKQEFVFGTNVGIWMQQASGPNLRLLFGAHYRINDAMIALVGLQSQSFRAAISYDFNISGLTTASNLRGGFELSAEYRLFRVPKYEYRGPTCPVF